MTLLEKKPKHLYPIFKRGMFKMFSKCFAEKADKEEVKLINSTGHL
jgi:hypothetical protein